MDHRSLTDIANLYGTDKGTVGPSKNWIAQNYTDVYEAYLAPYRHESITLLEIGLGVTGPAWDARIAHGRNRMGGASARMWYAYFPRARIYGIDVNSASHLDNDRIVTFVADQGDVAQLRTAMDRMGPVELDVVIDDGSHRPDHQQVSLGFFFPRLRSGGLYIIEDLMANGLGDRVSGRFACDSVRNTRAVLKAFRDSGRFAKPHALCHPDALARSIASVSFHAPTEQPTRRSPHAILRMLRGMPVPRRWVPDSERLCVLRRR